MKSVIIIGAGLGGLAAALRLRHLGFAVTVIEKQARPGGRSNVLQEGGFRVDIGPTILVMRQTFDIRKHIVWERQYRPADWARDINAPFGVAFGSLSHRFFQSSYFRPHNVARDIPGLYFVGQGTYPGIGMPMVLLSARLLAERLVKEAV